MQPADGSSPLLTLAAAVENGNVADAHNYFPRALIAPPALAWLDRAFVAGHLSKADLVLRGPIRHFPFRDGSGLFLARCALDRMTLDYSDGWPRVENLAAHAEFRNEGLSVRFLSGRVGNVAVDAADARFADFKTGELEIHVGAGGDAGDALAFLRATPLDASAEHAFSSVEAKGSMQTKVELFLPFKDFVNRRVLVHGHLDDVTLNRSGSTVAASNINGDFDIDGAQVAHADVRGRVLGGPFQMQARAPRNRPVTRTLLEFHGALSGDALRAALAMPPSLSIEGQTDWRATLRMAPEPNRERTLRVSSNLVGLEMKLPAPLDKPADAPMPSWFAVQWPAAGGPQGQLALGSVVSGAYALESDANGIRLAHVALTFGSGESSSTDTQIFNVGGSVARLDLAGWLKLIPHDQSAKPLSDYLRAASLQVAEIDYLGLAFRDVSVNLAVADGALRIAVGGPNVAGTITVPGATDAAEPWNLQFQRLHFDVVGIAQSKDEAADDDHKQAGASNLGDPHGIPAINFHAAELTWGERQFGDVQATLAKLDDGISLKDLNVTGANFNVSAKGEWRGKDAGLGRIEGTLTSSDVQDTLKQLGYAEVIDAKSGRMDFDLSWVGAPTDNALSEATGHVQLSLDKGQIVGLKPGAGQVLGLASVAALPRRLALDFSDLTDKGLAFDTVRADFDLREGSAYTDNVLVKGPAAEIGLIGRVGLKNKDYDQTAVVTGNLGSSPLPLAEFRGGAGAGRGGAALHASVQTAAERFGARVLSNYGQLGQSDCGTNQECRRGRRDCRGTEIMGKVAAIQMTSGHIVADNLAVAGDLLREAKDLGCDIACLPENFSFIGLRDADKLQVAEPDGEGAVQSFLSDCAREFKMWILGGTIVLRGDSDRRVANSSLLIDAAGRQFARYDKIHLSDVTIPGRDEQYRESTHVTPGRDLVVADTPVGEARTPPVCYDMRFPELYRDLVSQGAEWLAMPAAFTVPTGRAHWETLLRARAIENLCYVVAPAQDRHAPHERPRDVWRFDHRRLLGTGVVAPGKGCRSDHRGHRSCQGSGDSRARSRAR